MSDDIVTRLRLRPTILQKNQFGDMETDRAATALFDDCHAIMREAADEIERLRRNTGCARNQRSTQFCAEALDAHRGFETLQAQLGKNAIALAATLRELRKVEVERDEARRELRIVQAERDELQRELNAARQTIFQMLTKLAACCRAPSSETTLGDGETFIPEAL